MIECVFNFTFDIMWSWTDRRKEIILFYRNHNEDTNAISKATHKYSIGTRSIYKTLETGKYYMLKSGEKVLEESAKGDKSLPQFRFKSKITKCQLQT